MNELFPPLPLLATFIFTSVVLAVTPGPGVFYIVTRTLAQGRRAGLASVAGVALGNLGNALGATIGLTALFAFSSLAFKAINYAGAAYLIYLGVKMLRAPVEEIKIGEFGTANVRRVFRDGFIVALLNPKTAIFFAAFLPQFINLTTSPMLQSALLGLIFVIIAAATDTAYALACRHYRPRSRAMERHASVGTLPYCIRVYWLGTFHGKCRI